MRLYTSPREMKKKIVVGNFTVWSILLVSLMVSIFYWYQISGLTLENEKLGVFEEMMLWSAVAIGFLSELVKKVTLSTFRNKKIWVFATIVSILTVMGSFAILDQSRGASLKKDSDSYKTAVDDKAEAKKEMGRYAHVANKSMESLVALEADNNAKGGSNSARKKSGMTYKQFVSNRARIKQDIQDRKDYESAEAMYNIAKKDMTGSGSSGAEVSNPLFAQIHDVTGFAVNAITLTFFLAVTLLLEISAYYIGGEIEDFKNFLNLTEAELLDIQNMSMFGVSMRSINRDNFARITDAMRDQQEADTLIMQMRLNRTNENGEVVSAGEVSGNVRNMRDDLARNHRSARGDVAGGGSDAVNNAGDTQNNAEHNHSPLRGQYVIAGELDLEGYTLEQLKNRRDNVNMSSENPTCPACMHSYPRLSRNDVFCHPDHRREFNNQIRRLRRAS